MIDNLQEISRILRILWTNHITNQEVLRRVGKMEYLGHVMRHEKHPGGIQLQHGGVDSRRD